MKRFLSVGWLLVVVALWTSCGDTFRPIIIPNPPTFPDPRATHSVLSINNNGTVNRGSVQVVDVSGDSVVAAADLGIAPVHAVQQGANQVLVANQSTPGMVADSLMKLSISGSSINGAPSTISLPPDSAPNFVATTQLDTAYVLLPHMGPPSLGVVNTTAEVLIDTVPVGTNPVAIAETPDQTKLYVANQGDSTISAFNVIDRTPRAIVNSANAFTAPTWITARSDSQRVFVLNGDGTLTTLDTSGAVDSVQSRISVGSGANYIVYDTRLNRLYIPAASQVTILDAAQSQVLAILPIPTVSPSMRGANDPCLTTTQATPLAAVVAAALPDQTRAYVGAFYTDMEGNLCPQVTVINTAGNTIKTSMAVPGFPDAGLLLCSTTTRFRFSMAAAGDSSRVYMASCDAGNIGVIRTSDDNFLVNLPAMTSARSPTPPSTQPPPQNPVFLLAGP